MKNLLLKELRTKRFSFWLYCGLGLGLVWMYIALFPSLNSQAQSISKLYAGIPSSYLKAFGAQDLGLSSVESFLAGKHFGLVWPLLAILLVVSRAGAAYSGEIEQGTMGTLLSQPISRGSIYWSKYLATLISLLVFIILSVAITIPFAHISHVAISAGHVTLFSVLCLLFGLAILGLSSLVSAASSERGKVYSFVGGTLLVMYILNVVAAIKDSLAWLRYGSMFHYFDVNLSLVHGHLSVVGCLLFAGLALVGALGGLTIFRRRDISS